MTNREVAEFIFSKIKSCGFEPYNVDYGNGYFIIEMGEDSVVHFRLKGVWKNWKFGMWVNSEYLDEEYRKNYAEKYPKSNGEEWKAEDFKVVQVFCQHEHNIDKFKPARSALCVDIDYEDFEHEKEGTWTWAFSNLESMVKMIKKHPILCYNDYCGDINWYQGDSFLKYFLKMEFNYYKDEINEKVQKFIFYHWTIFKLFFAKRSKIIDNIRLEDFEKEWEGWSTNYKYQVHPTFKADATDEQISKWFNTWFRKDNYGKIGYYDCVVKAGNFKIVGKEREFYLA